MAESDKIKQDDLYEKDLLKPLINDGKALIKVFDELKVSFTKIADEQAKIAKNSSKKLKNADDISKTTKALSEAAKARERANKIDKEKINLEQKLKILNSTAIDKNTELKILTQEQAKINKQFAREKLGLVGAYEKEARKLADLRKKYKDLAISEGESSKESKKLLQQITKLDTKLKNVDASAGQFQRNVGNYPSAFKGAIGALKNFAGALGITAGLTGLVSALRNSIKIAKDFEQGNANLAAVLGKTSSQITNLTADAKRLGAATSFSASQVSELQTEFAKLGFNEQEILNATEATLSLAAATGSDLGGAAAIAGATLGGFGLDASETQRVVDVMAKSFSTSALDIEKFRESMKDAAPAAKAVGVDVEETTALLGTLANAGISGSKAGNALKNTFIQLNKAGLTLEEGLDKVRNSNDKLGTATKLVGKIAATSFLTLADGVDITNDLEKGLRNAGGAAEKMAKEQLNTLQGRLTILNSAWEGFVLSILSGDSAFNKVANAIVETTTNFLGLITATEKESDALVKQRAEMESLVGAITNANNSEETRKKLIDELNQKYPSFLENLDKEKVTNEELVSRLKDVNAELTKKIIIKKKEEELTELIEEQTELRILEIKQLKEVAKAQALVDKNKGIQIKTSEGLVDASEKYLVQLGKESARLDENRRRQEDISKEIENITDIYDELNPKVEENTKVTKTNTGATTENAEARRDVESISSLQAKAVDQVTESKEKELTATEKLQEALDKEILKRREVSFTVKESIDREIAFNKALVDARLSTAKSISSVSQIIAGEDEDRQRAVMAVDKAIATGEIIINLQREISDIRTNNAKNDTTQLNAPQITAATAAAFAGIATIASQSFFDGTENTGNGGKVDDRGGFYAVLHPNERVMTARQNAKVGDLSNNELADIALMYNRGDLVNPFTDMALNITSNDSKKDNTNHLIISELRNLQIELKNKPVSQFAFDRMGNMIETRFSNGVKDIIKHQAKKRV